MQAPPPPPAVQAFLRLSSAQRETQEGATALVGLLQALVSGYDPAPEQRRKLLTAVLATASNLVEQPTSPLLGPLCTTLKLLGRSPAGSEELGRENGLKTLVRLGGLGRLAELPRQVLSTSEEQENDDDETQAAQRTLAQAEADPLLPHEAEALRCLCNVLTLHPSAREIFPDLFLADDKRSALQGLNRILDITGAGFLAGRLLFLVTSKASDVISELAVGRECIETMERFAKRYLTLYNSPTHRNLLSSGPPTSTMDDVLKEHLKLAYNLMLQYSRRPAAVPEGFGKLAIDDGGGKKKRFWRSREKSGGSSTPTSPEVGADAALDATSPVSSPSLPSGEEPARSKSPLSFAKRAVDAVKHRSNSPSQKSIDSQTSSPTLNSTSPASLASELQEGNSPDGLSLTASHLFLPLFQPYLSIAVRLPLLPPASPASPSPSLKDPSLIVRAALATLLNFPTELEELSGYSTSWTQYVPSRLADDGTVLHGGGVGSLGERLIELLEGVCNAYFPVDRVPASPKLVTKKDREEGKKLVPPVAPDEWIQPGEGEATKIEEILGPVMLLLRKMSMIGEAQYVFQNVLLPPNVDRTLPLDRHPTLAGHLVRLLTSILLPNTSFGVGEFVYNLCNRDPLTLVRAIGYGNASGFLSNRGELIPPPAEEEYESASAGGAKRTVNPITGAFEAAGAVPAGSDMTEDEKEREAEKLYTLFERMKRTGVMNAENPVEKARAAGRFEETTEAREAELERLRKEDEELEAEVERDMVAWKERRKKATKEQSS